MQKDGAGGTVSCSVPCGPAGVTVAKVTLLPNTWEKGGKIHFGAIPVTISGPVVESVHPPIGTTTTTGGNSIAIRGKYFGAKQDDVDVTMDGRKCLNLLRIDETRIMCEPPSHLSAKGSLRVIAVECVTPSGFGEAVDVTVSVSGATFDESEKFKYLKPTVDR